MKFRHPSISTGRISFEQDHYEIVDGVVDCPASVGAAAGLEPIAGDAPKDAKKAESKHEAKKTGDAPKDAKKSE
jgi:hypothetical protein